MINHFDPHTCINWIAPKPGKYFLTVANKLGCVAVDSLDLPFSTKKETFPIKPEFASLKTDLNNEGVIHLNFEIKLQDYTLTDSDYWLLNPAIQLLKKSEAGKRGKITFQLKAEAKQAGILPFHFRGRFKNNAGEALQKDTTFYVKVPFVTGMDYEVACGNDTNYSIALYDRSSILPSEASAIKRTFAYHDGTRWKEIPLKDSNALEAVQTLSPGAYRFRETIVDNRDPKGYRSSFEMELILPKKPNANFTMQHAFLPAKPCEWDVPVTFIPQDTNQKDWVYEWDWDGWRNCRNKVLNKVFYQEGPSLMVLKVTDPATGCTTRDTQLIEIRANHYMRERYKGVYDGRIDQRIRTRDLSCMNQIPVLNYSPDPSCLMPFQYAWYVNGRLIPEADSSTYIPKEMGGYRSVGTDNSGCLVVSDFVSVLANEAPQPKIAGPQKVSAQTPFRLSGYAGDEVKYEWVRYPGEVKVGENYLLDEKGLPAGIYTYFLTVNYKDCKKTSSPFKIVVE